MNGISKRAESGDVELDPVSRGPHLPRQWKWVLHSISEICLINEHAFQNVLLLWLCDYVLLVTWESILLV